MRACPPRVKPILLFAGPSLPEEADTIAAPILLRPPARCGDLARALDDDPAAILLVDGVFEIAPTVWHKEILLVLARGIPVYGAASLGALRAAELDRHGMIGAGMIYEAYRDGAVESDAAVMVAHAPAALGYRPLTLALVDAEASLLVAALDPDDRRLLQGIARRINFRDRTWPAIVGAFAARRGIAQAERARSAITVAAYSQKSRDTADLIALVQRQIAGPPPPAVVPRTIYMEELINICAG